MQCIIAGHDFIGQYDRDYLKESKTQPHLSLVSLADRRERINHHVASNSKCRQVFKPIGWSSAN